MNGKTNASTRKSRRTEATPETSATPSNNNSTDSNSNNMNNTSNNNNNFTMNKNGSTSCPTRLPAIKERRSSVVKKLKVTSVNDESNSTAPQPQGSPTTTTTTTTTAATTTTSNASTAIPSIQRRSSIPPTPQAASSIMVRRGSKPSFAGIGKRVSTMVKARLAFQRSGRAAHQNSETEANHMEHIHEMPRNPRFTTFLSAEAQYAIMKGYEDKLYDKIASTSPESKLILKRNKTPFLKKIGIVDNDSKKSAEDGSGNADNKSLMSSSDENTPSNTPSDARTSPTSPSSDIHRSSSPEASSSRSEPLPSPFLKPLRSQSVLGSSSGKNGTLSSMTRSSYPATGGVGLQRSSSLVALDEGLSHNKRLVLTYRLESAMDILDTIKRRNMEHSLSPRVFRIPRQVDAVRDFNSWTKVWNKEFKEVKAK